MAETYTLHVAGLTRELTICKVNDHMDIAAFIMLGDAELTVAAAAELLKQCPHIVGVCSANTSEKALRGALRSGIFTHIAARAELVKSLLGQ